MAEKKNEPETTETETVTLIAPNGQTVTVAESKKAERIAAGYGLPGKEKEPEKKPAAKGRASAHTAKN